MSVCARSRVAVNGGSDGKGESDEEDEEEPDRPRLEAGMTGRAKQLGIASGMRKKQGVGRDTEEAASLDPAYESESDISEL